MSGDEIIERCGPLIRSLGKKAAQRFGGDVDDWAQDLALDVIQNAHVYDPNRAALTTWIYLRATSLTSRLQAKIQRRNRIARNVQLADDEDEGREMQLADPRAADPSEDIGRREECDRVRAGLKVMSPREAFAVACRFGLIDGNELYREIGDAMGVTPARVGQLIRSGCEKLAAELRWSAV